MSLSSFYSVLLSYPLSPSEFYLQCAQGTELDWGQSPCRFKLQSGWEQNPLFSLIGWSELQSCSPSPREGGASWGSWWRQGHWELLFTEFQPQVVLWTGIQGVELISVWLLIDTEISLICLLAGESWDFRKVGQLCSDFPFQWVTEAVLITWKCLTEFFHPK